MSKNNKTKKHMPNWAKFVLTGTISAIVAAGIASAITIPLIQAAQNGKDGKDASLPKFSCNFVNNDGTLLYNETVELGKTPTYSKIPTRANPEEYVNYEFAGWDHDVEAGVTKNMTYTATYNETYPTCTLKYMNNDGTLFETITARKYDHNNFPKPETKPDWKGPEEGKQHIHAAWVYPLFTGQDEVVVTPYFDETISDIEYQVVEKVPGIKEVSISSYSNTQENVEIKESWGGYPVTEIADHAFEIGESNSSTTKIKSITLPDSIQRIGKSAFKGNSALVDIKTSTANGVVEHKLPDSIEAIGTNAFENCTGLEQITLPENELFEVIPESAFANTGLKNAVVPNSVIRVENKAFGDCAELLSIHLGTLVSESTNFGCVEGCSKLATITVEATNENFKTDPTSTALLNKAGTKLIRCMPAYDQALSIPNTIQEISSYAFQDSQIPSIDFSTSTSLKTLGAHAFENCALTTVDLTNTAITLIPEYCFNGCKLMTEFKFASGVIKVEQYAFNNCEELAEIWINASLMWDSIDGLAFVNCKKLAKIHAESHPNLQSDGNGILYKKLEDDSWQLICCPPGCATPKPAEDAPVFTSIGSYAFNGCDFTNTDRKFIMPDSVTKNAGFMFNNATNLDTVRVGKGLTIAGIDSQCLKGSSFKTFEVDDDNEQMCGVAGILYTKNKAALLRCPPKYDFASGLTIPSSVVQIADFGFKDTAIPTFKLTNNITKIGNLAFNGTTQLQSIEIETTLNPNLEVAENAFLDAGPESTGVYMVKFDQLDQTGGTKSDIEKMHTYLGRNITMSIDDPNVETINANAFELCDYLNGLTFGDNTQVKYISKRAFFNCRNIQLINLPTTLLEIQNDSQDEQTGAFENCKSLTTIAFPESCTSIGNCAFRGCTKLQNVIFAQSASQNCTIGKYAFNGCGSLEVLNLEGSNIKSIGDGSFANTGLTTIKLGKLESIGNYCFSSNYITEVTLPTSLLPSSGIGRYSFNGCTNIQHVNYEGTKAEWLANKPFGSYNPFAPSNINVVFCKGDNQYVSI